MSARWVTMRCLCRQGTTGKQCQQGGSLWGVFVDKEQQESNVSKVGHYEVSLWTRNNRKAVSARWVTMRCLCRQGTAGKQCQQGGSLWGVFVDKEQQESSVSKVGHYEVSLWTRNNRKAVSARWVTMRCLCRQGTAGKQCQQGGSLWGVFVDKEQQESNVSKVGHYEVSLWTRNSRKAMSARWVTMRCLCRQGTTGKQCQQGGSLWGVFVDKEQQESHVSKVGHYEVSL